MKERLAQTFYELVGISEVYPHEKEIISYIENYLKKIGLSPQRDNFNNIITKVDGTGKPFMINTHMDIPENNHYVGAVREGDVIKSDGSGILGADPKSGIAVILEFLKDLADKKKNHNSIEVVITRGEEKGLIGAHNLDYSLIDSEMGIVLDEDGPVTQVVAQAPFKVKIDATFTGRAVHSREPEKAINALQVANEAMSSISWGRPHPEVIWNIGLFNAGTAENTTPAKAEMQAEMRSHDTDLLYSELDKIEQLFLKTAKKFKAGCSFKKSLTYKGYKIEKDSVLVSKLEETYKKMGLVPNCFSTLGSSDANVFNDKGMACVAVGSGYYNAHQHTEYVDLNDMTQIVEFLKIFTSSKLDD